MAKTFQDTITVTFKSKGDKDLVRAINKLGRATKNLIKPQVKLEKEFRLFNTTTKKTSKNVGMLDTRNKRLAKTNGILANSFATIRSKMLLWSFAISLGVRQIISMAKESSKVEAMEMGFNTLAGATEVSAVALMKLKSATNDTMSEFDLFKQANNAMILGVTKNSDEMAEMFDVAQRLGRALGQDTASSVESLITGIGRQSRLMLDNIGIIVKAEEAYESYADSLNISADDLTDVQKKQAFLTATMESARQKVATLGEETLTSRDKFDALDASSSNLANAIGGILSPAFAVLAENTSSVLDNITELINLKTDNRGLETIFWDTFEEGEEAVKSYARTYGTHIIGINQPLIRQLEQLRTSAGEVQKDLGKTYGGKLRKGYQDVSKDVRFFSELIDRLTESTRAYNVERDKKISLEQTRKELEMMEAQEAEYRRLNPEIATSEELQKKVKDALDATTASRITSIQATIAQLKADEALAVAQPGFEDAQANYDRYTQAIETATKSLRELQGYKDNSTKVDGAVASALASTTTRQIAFKKAVLESLEAVDNPGHIIYAEAIKKIREEIEKLENPQNAMFISYKDFESTQQAKLEKTEQEAWLIQALIDTNYDLAKAMGFVESTMTDSEKRAQSAIEGTVVHKQSIIQETLKQLKLEKALLDNRLREDPMFEPEGGFKHDEEEVARREAIIEAIGAEELALIELAETKKSTWSESVDMGLEQFQQASGAYSSFVQGAVDSDINALKARDDYQRASTEQRAVMEEDIRRKHSTSLRRSAILEKASSVAQATINTYEAVTDAMPNLPLAGLVGALGAVQIAGIVATPLAYRQGGMIGGQSHDQGGTIIEAERGEFVMSKKAVDSVGVENMKKINNLTSDLSNMIPMPWGGNLPTKLTVSKGVDEGRYEQGGLIGGEMPSTSNGGGLTINISAPLVDETVIDHIIPAIEKARRMNLA